MVVAFESDEMITEYELLTYYNPKIINSKIKAIQTQINLMYHLNLSHVSENEMFGLIPVSYPLESLVLNIIDQKERLSNYKSKSIRNIKRLKSVIKNYSDEEQRQVMIYMATHGKTSHTDTILKLQKDLYKAIQRDKRVK